MPLDTDEAISYCRTARGAKEEKKKEKKKEKKREKRKRLGKSSGGGRTTYARGGGSRTYNRHSTSFMFYSSIQTNSKHTLRRVLPPRHRYRVVVLLLSKLSGLRISVQGYLDSLDEKSRLSFLYKLFYNAVCIVAVGLHELIFILVD